MTRNEALQYFKELEEKWLNPTDEYIAHISTKLEIVEHGRYFSEALTILAPEPRKEPPTVDEVAGDKPCLCLDVDGDWLTIDGEMARRRWKDWMLIAWLPYSALPKGDV